MDIQQFEERKRDHIRHALSPTNQTPGLSGLEHVHLVHEALPDLDFNEVRLNSVCLGQPARTPFYISGMTAGHADAVELNRRLALACQERGWAMGVGSQRRQLDSPGTKVLAIDQWKRLREEVPDLVLFGNVGIAQIIHQPVAALRELVDSISAQGLAVHVNPLQECMQPEGTPSFKGAIPALAELVKSIRVPVILKETGCGFSEVTLMRLKKLGLVALDVAGLGGTHWGRIEGARAFEGDSMSVHAAAARTFGNWGESTGDSVQAATRVLCGTEIWASGGVRSGLDAAKLIALGAQRVGYAQPALEAAIAGPVPLRRWMELQEYELKVALFCTGSCDIEMLRRGEGKWIKTAE